LWKDRDDLQGKVFSMLQDLFQDADKRKELADAQKQVIADQARAMADLSREFAALREELRRRP
jgi:uncharacterized coiled-coil DUF342 family protein